MKTILATTILATALLLPIAGRAATIPGDLADSEINQNGNNTTADGSGTIGAATATSLRSGESFNSGRNVEYVFQLPTLAAGESFATASLTFNYTATAFGGNGGFTVDLYGLGRRASNVTLGGDYFEGTLDTTDATLLQTGILTTSTSTGSQTTSGVGSTALGSYLNAQYASGTGAGQFVFLRISPQQATTTNLGSGYQLDSADNATPANRPFITFTVVPEPSTWAMLTGGMGMLGLVRRRR